MAFVQMRNLIELIELTTLSIALVLFAYSVSKHAHSWLQDWQREWDGQQEAYELGVSDLIWEFHGIFGVS